MPDARYIGVRKRQWLRLRPRLASDRHQALNDKLIGTRRAIGRAPWSDSAALAQAHTCVYADWYAGEPLAP